MPVTVKFSRGFYDKFGHEAVDELVSFFNQMDQNHRSELRELNEVNFTRFKAEMRAQLAESEARLLRWMFVFWAPTALGVVALLLRG
jgi:hypothetical protein